MEWTRSYDPAAEGGTPVPTPDVHVASVARADDGYALAGRIRREGEAYDPILLRTDAEGRERWRRSFGGGNVDRASCVVATADGGFLVAGDRAETGRTPPGGPGETGWVAKTDAEGRERWSTAPDPDRRAKVEAVLQTSDGGFALAGWVEESAGYAGWFARLDAAGQPVVDRTYDTSDDDRSPTHDYHVAELFATVAQTSDGGFVLGGRYARGGRVQKVDPEGDTRWRTSFEFPHDVTRDVLEAENGDLLVTGRLYGRPKEGKYTATGEQFPTDLYLTRLDASGAGPWTRAYDGGANEAGQAVVPAEDGGFVVAGGSRRYDAYGRTAAFLVRTDADGEGQWSGGYFDGDRGGPAWDVVRAPDGGYAFAAGEVFAKLADVPAPPEEVPTGTAVETLDPSSTEQPDDTPVAATDRNEVPEETENVTVTGTTTPSPGS